MSDSVIHFGIRGEIILLSFLKGFFSQEQLYGDFPNPFRYIDNKDNPSLKILRSEDPDEVQPMPAIILQEGGFTEDAKTIGPNLNYQLLARQEERYKGSFFHPYTLHCIGRSKGEAKFLQAATARAIISFRKAIYALGVDHITPLQGGPPQRLSAVDKQAPSQPYDCTISFQAALQQDWIVSRKPDGVIDYEEEVCMKIYAALSELEFNENGEPTSPVDEWFQIQIDL